MSAKENCCCCCRSINAQSRVESQQQKAAKEHKTDSGSSFLFRLVLSIFGIGKRRNSNEEKNAATEIKARKFTGLSKDSSIEESRQEKYSCKIVEHFMSFVSSILKKKFVFTAEENRETKRPSGLCKKIKSLTSEIMLASSNKSCHENATQNEGNKKNDEKGQQKNEQCKENTDDEKRENLSNDFAAKKKKKSTKKSLGKLFRKLSNKKHKISPCAEGTIPSSVDTFTATNDIKSSKKTNQQEVSSEEMSLNEALTSNSSSSELLVKQTPILTNSAADINAVTSKADSQHDNVEEKVSAAQVTSAASNTSLFSLTVSSFSVPSSSSMDFDSFSTTDDMLLKEYADYESIVGKSAYFQADTFCSGDAHNLEDKPLEANATEKRSNFFVTPMLRKNLNPQFPAMHETAWEFSPKASVNWKQYFSAKIARSFVYSDGLKRRNQKTSTPTESCV